MVQGAGLCACLSLYICVIFNYINQFAPFPWDVSIGVGNVRHCQIEVQ